MRQSEELVRMLEEAGQRLNVELDLEWLESDAQEKMLHLVDVAGEPGWDRAMLAERDNLAREIGLNTSETAGMADRELLGLIGGALGMAVREMLV